MGCHADLEFTWRAMSRLDLPQVQAIASMVHPAYPERLEVFSERLALFPAGCLVLQGAPNQVAGYAISHPWHQGQPPLLDSLLGGLPPTASTYYLHDLALLPEARGQGAPTRLLALLTKTARALALAELSLVAVNGSRPYWLAQRFEVLHLPALAGKLQSYDADACLMRLSCDATSNPACPTPSAR